MQDYQNLASELVRRAVERGADEADVFVTEGRSLSLELRFGRVERIEEAGASRLGLRVIKNGSTALSYSSDFSPAALERLVGDTLGLVAVTDPHPANRLPPPELLGRFDGPLHLFDPALESLTLDRKLEMVRAMEEAGLQSDSRISNVNDAWWRDGTHSVTIANSHGFVDSYKYSSCGIGTSLVAEGNGVKQQDGWSSTAHSVAALEDPVNVGRQAARRTLRKLGARSVKTQVAPIVFDPLMAADFMRNLFSAVSAYSIFRGASFLVDKIDQQVGNSLLNVVDDPTLVDGLASRPFDAEGVRSRRNEVIQEGRLCSYLSDAYAANRLQQASTGNAVRSFSSSPTAGASNFFLKPTSTPPEDLIRSVKRGLYLTRQYWVGFNLASGDYSRGAEGVWIEDGELTHCVQEITIAGNMLEMMKNIEAVASDLEFLSPVASPTFLISRMMISGR